LIKAEKCALYRAERDVYLELAKGQGDYTKLKLKERVPAADPERSNFLAVAGNLFGLAADVSATGNRIALVEGLDNFPWRVAATDRAKLLLAAAKDSAGQPAVRAAVKKVLDRDAGLFDPAVAAQIRQALGP
jgi:hypothetical protein